MDFELIEERDMYPFDNKFMIHKEIWLLYSKGYTILNARKFVRYAPDEWYEEVTGKSIRLENAKDLESLRDEVKMEYKYPIFL